MNVDVNSILATEEAACVLAYISLLNDLDAKVDATTEYLEKVQAEASREDYDGFVGCLREFARDILFPITRRIDKNKDFVIKCAWLFLEEHDDLIVGLSDYIPEIFDTFLAKKRREQLESEGEESRQELATQSVPAKRQRLLQTVASELEHLEKCFLQEQEKKILGQRTQEQKRHARKILDQEVQNEMTFFMGKVRERLLPSDPATYTKIESLMQQFFVEGNMSEKEAMKTMWPLMQWHNDLWKEFQEYLSEDLREDFMEDDPQPGLLSAEMCEELTTEEVDDLQLALQKSIAEATGKHEDNPS